MNEPTDTPTPRSDSFAIPYHAIKCPRFPNGKWDVNGRWVSLGDCRTLERENQQLQREVVEAKKWKEVVELATAVHLELTKLFGVCAPSQMPRFAKDKLDHFQHLSAEWEKMARELAASLERTVIPTGPCMFRYIQEQKELLSRFQTLTTRQPKKDEQP